MEKVFKEKLENAKPEVPAHLWENIAQHPEMRQFRMKKKGMKWGVGTSIAVVAIVGTVFTAQHFMTPTPSPAPNYHVASAAYAEITPQENRETPTHTAVSTPTQQVSIHSNTPQNTTPLEITTSTPNIEIATQNPTETTPVSNQPQPIIEEKNEETSEETSEELKNTIVAPPFEPILTTPTSNSSRSITIERWSGIRKDTVLTTQIVTTTTPIYPKNIFPDTILTNPTATTISEPITNSPNTTKSNLPGAPQNNTNEFVRADNIEAVIEETIKNEATLTDENREKSFPFKNDTQESGVYIPNAFKPLSASGNHLFKVVTTREITDFAISIIDRGGQIVYQSRDISDGWDGNLNGVPAEMGVYIYIVNYKDIDGELIRKRGTVTLLR